MTDKERLEQLERKLTAFDVWLTNKIKDLNDRVPECIDRKKLTNVDKENMNRAVAYTVIRLNYHRHIKSNLIK